MNGSGMVQLGDTQIGAAAAAGKSEHHKSLNKTDLATAQGQAFSKMLLAAQNKGDSAAPEESELETQTEETKPVPATHEETTADEAEAPQENDTVAVLNPEWK